MNDQLIVMDRWADEWISALVKQKDELRMKSGMSADRRHQRKEQKAADREAATRL